MLIDILKEATADLRKACLTRETSLHRYDIPMVGDKNPMITRPTEAEEKYLKQIEKASNKEIKKFLSEVIADGHISTRSQFA